MSLGTINYCRKSEEDKARQVLSIEDQLLVGRELLDRHNLAPLVCPPIVDEKSAKKAGKRPGFDKMIKLLDSGRADTITCWRINRLARNGKEAGIIINLVDNKNVVIVTEIGTYDKNNSAMIWIEMMQATEYSKSLSKDVKRGLASKARMGHASHKAPLGYRNTPEKVKGQKSIEKDDKTWDLMRQWFDLVLSEKYNVMESLAIMTEKGLRTHQGKIVSKTSAYRLLTNIFYTGRFIYKGEVMDNGLHPRMISDTEHFKILKIIRGTPHKEKEQEDPLPFKGFMKCGECGTTITGDKKIKKIKETGEQKLFAYYRCNQQTSIKGKKTCHQPYLPAEKLNEQIKGYLDRLEIHPDFIQLVRDTMKRRNAKEFEVEKKNKEIQSKKLERLMDEKQRLYGMKIDGLITQEDYNTEKNRLLKEEMQIKSYINRDGTAYWESVIDETLDFAQTIRDRFESGDINQKILVLKTLSSNLILKDKQLDLSPKYAFMFLKEAENAARAKNGSVEPNSNLENGGKEPQVSFGAGNGNRTRLFSLGRRYTTDVLYPQYVLVTRDVVTFYCITKYARTVVLTQYVTRHIMWSFVCIVNLYKNRKGVYENNQN